MATITKITDNEKYLLNNNRVFLQSKNINIFPCSRRGQSNIEDTATCYDPEARLNTERTNRLGTAINGFTDSFISDFDRDTGSESPSGTLVFTLAGYRVEAKNVNPEKTAELLSADDTDIIYAYLGIHGGISLNTAGYYTDILYRQSEEQLDKNYLDVFYEDVTDTTIKDDFFVGISFTKNKDTADTGVTPHTLPIFSKVGDTWELVETSKLPKIEHDTEPDSIKLSGDFTVKHGEQTSFKVTKDETILGPTAMSSLVVGEVTDGDFQDGTIKAKEHIETPTLEATESIKTLELKTNTITSDSAEVITVNKKLTLSANTSITTPVANVHSTLNVTNSAKNAKADIDDLMSDKATIGDLVVKAGLNNSTGKIIALNSQITNNATIYDLDVGTNIDTSTLKATTNIATPLLKANNITSDNTEIVIDKALKVDAKLSAGATDVDSLAVDGTVYLKSTAQIDGETTLYNKLLVKSGSTIRAEIDSSKVSFNLPVTAGQYINVGSPTIPTQTPGDIVAKNSIFAENQIVAKNAIKAPTVYQTVNSIDKLVPFIDLVEQDSGCWQMQISRVNKVNKIEN